MNTYLRASFIFVLCFFAILLHATVGMSVQSGLIASVSFYPPRMNPGQSTIVTVMVTDSNQNPVHGATVQLRAPEQGYFVQTNSRFSVGYSDQSGMYKAVWRASAYSSDRFQVTVTKQHYAPWSMGYLFIVDGATYNYPPPSPGSQVNSISYISYTIANSTNYPIRLVFLPTGNTDSLAPGQTKSCRSPIRNGAFPKVKAHAPNGKSWLRTISMHGGNYRIISHGDKGIKIVP